MALLSWDWYPVVSSILLTKKSEDSLKWNLQPIPYA